MLGNNVYDGMLNAYPLTTIGTSATWLRSHLQESRLTLAGNAGLSRILLVLDDFRRRALRDETFTFDSSDSAYAYFSAANGADLLSKLLHEAHIEGLALDVKLLKRLVKGEPNPFAGATRSRDRDLAWELVVAGALTRFASDVRFNEPDLRCTWASHAVNIAAKMIYSHKQLWHRVVEGHTQAAKYPADVDVVFANVVNLLPCVEMFRLSRSQAFDDATGAVAWAKQWALEWCETRELYKTVARLEQRATRPILVAFFMPLLIAMPPPFGPTPFFYIHAPITTQGADFDFGVALEGAFNGALAEVLPKPRPL